MWLHVAKLETWQGIRAHRYDELHTWKYSDHFFPGVDGGRPPQHQPSFGAVCGPPFLPCPVVWSSNANAALLVRVPSK